MIIVMTKKVNAFIQNMSAKLSVNKIKKYRKQTFYQNTSSFLGQGFILSFE